MKAICLLVAGLLGALLSAQEHIADFNAAEELMEQRKYTAAAEAFDKIAAIATGPQKVQAQLKKALALGQARKLDDALKAAELLTDAKLKAYAQMNACYQSNKWADVIAKFGDEKIEEWPEEFAYKGWYIRGSSFGNSKQYDRALSELERAAVNAGSDSWLQMLAYMDGATFADQKGDFKQAIAIADKAIAMKKLYADSYTYLRPAMLKVEILTRQKKFNEAKIAMDDINSERLSGVWLWRYNMISGNLALAGGNRDLAKDFYQHALKAAGREKHLITSTEKKLAEMENSTK